MQVAKQLLCIASQMWWVRSSGNHGAGQVVTWTGVLDVKREALGVKLHWRYVFLFFLLFGCVFFLCCGRAYSPGEYKVLVSSDGGNFEEAACWRSSSRSEVSYEETILFKNVQSAKAVAVVMKGPMPWGYFGLSDVSLVTAGEEAFMIVKSSSSHDLEECVIASGRGVSAQTCSDAVAAGDGRDVFKFRDGNLIHSGSGLCVALAGGAGNQVNLQDCVVVTRADDGRASWQLTAEGQLKLTRSGNYCFSVSFEQAAVSDCGDASQKFAFAVVPEMRLSVVAFAQDQAGLLVASAARQRRLLSDLQARISGLGACKFAASSFAAGRNFTKMHLGGYVAQRTNGRADAAINAIGKIYSGMGLDIASLKQLIGESSNVLETAHARLSPSA